MHESTYKKEIVPKINETEELSEGIFFFFLKITDQYLHKDPSLKAKYKTSTYQKCFFFWRKEYTPNVITCEDNF